MWVNNKERTAISFSFCVGVESEREKLGKTMTVHGWRGFIYKSVGAWRSNRPVPPAPYQMNLYWWCTLSFVQCYMNPSRAGGMMLMTVGGGEQERKEKRVEGAQGRGNGRRSLEYKL